MRPAAPPRVRRVPRYHSSAGPEAIELAASAGLVLDPWQAAFLTDALGERRDGRWAAFEVALWVARQNGKGPHALWTPVLTTEGWTTIGEIRAGQHVYGADGSPTRVVGCSPIFLNSTCYEVELTDGATYVVSGSHLWHVQDKNSGRWQNITTEHMATRVGARRADNGRMEFRYRVRCDAVPDTPEADLPIDPWLLGFWLGDGSCGRAEVTVGREDLAWACMRLEAAGAEVTACGLKNHQRAHQVAFRIDRKWSPDGFLPRARRLGVLTDKHIPEVYLTASPKQRTALLAGLMDSDGSVAVTNRSPQVEFTTSFPRLAETFHRLVRSLGVRVSRKEGRSSLNGVAHRPRSRFLWTPTFDPFQMPRKSAYWQVPSSRRHEVMSVTGVRPVASVPTRCIEIDRPDGVYLVGHLFTPTHNSILEARELFGLFLGDEKLIIHTAHEVKTSIEAFRRVLGLIQNTPDLDRRVSHINRKNGEEGIELVTGQRLRFLARSRTSARGFSADLVIWDEAQELLDDHVDAQMPTLSARANPQLWYTGSPPTDPLRGATAMSLHRRGEAGDEPDLCYYDYGAQVGVDPDDVDVWRRTNPGFGHRISEETIRRERAAMSPEGFVRERLCVWPAKEADPWQVITERDWTDARDPESLMTGRPAFVVAMSLDRAWTLVAAAGARPDGLRHVQVLDSRPGSGWVVERLKELRRRWRPWAIGVRPTGPASSLLGAMEEARLDVTRISVPEGCQAAGMFYDALAGTVVDGRPTPRNVRHLGQGVLDVAVARAVPRKVGNVWTWDMQSPTVDCSPLEAVSDALWLFVTANRSRARGTPAPAAKTGAGAGSDFFRGSGRLSL